MWPKRLISDVLIDFRCKFQFSRGLKCCHQPNACHCWLMALFKAAVIRLQTLYKPHGTRLPSSSNQMCFKMQRYEVVASSVLHNFMLRRHVEFTDLTFIKITPVYSWPKCLMSDCEEPIFIQKQSLQWCFSCSLCLYFSCNHLDGGPFSVTFHVI